jgi:hypothetical protein
MDLSLVLRTNYFDCLWSLVGNSYDGLEWLDESPKPTEAELEAQWADVQYKVAYDAVSASRHLAYVAPNGSDAVFMKYQRGEATEQEWLDAVQAINDANPYPVKEGK